MNGIDNSIIFYPSAILMILFAFLTIFMKNIFRSLLCAIVVFFLAGLFFYVLGSEYNAVIQIAIYGVAIPVILGLAIMFTEHKSKKEEKEKKNSNRKYIAFLFSGLFILTCTYLILTSLAILPNSFDLSERITGNSIQVLSSISNAIFVKYVYAFEIISLILTIIVVGLSFLKREEAIDE